MLWTDKYRPKDLDSLDYLKEQAADLKNLAKSDELPHLLIHGPLGSGKSTRIKCLLKALYGPGVEKLKAENVALKTPSNTTFEITILSSNYHIEVNPSDANYNDRIVVMEMIKSVAQTQQLNNNAQRNFKVIVLNEADKISQQAQHALRRTMEKYMNSCRIILCANSPSSIIPAIRSRCLSIRVPAPSHDMIKKILQNISRQEGLTLPDKLAQSIVEQSERNLRRAILFLECCRVEKYPFVENQQVQCLDWQKCISKIADKMIKNPSVRALSDIRQYFYELLTNGLPVKTIFCYLVDNLLDMGEDDLYNEIVEVAVKFELSAIKGDKEIVHLEAFAANCMCIYQDMMKSMISEF